MPAMRAKMRLHHIDKVNSPNTETLYFHAVAASKYPEDGSDENNSYAKFSPSANLQLSIANPVLIGKFEAGEEYYVDFTKAG